MGTIWKNYPIYLMKPTLLKERIEDEYTIRKTTDSRKKI